MDNVQPSFVLDPDGDPCLRPELTLESTWWAKDGHESYHVLVGGVWVANIAVVDGKVVIEQQANPRV